MFEFSYDFSVDSLEKANDVNVTKPENKTKYPDDAKILMTILEQNETVNSQDILGYTALHRACRQGINGNKFPND